MRKVKGIFTEFRKFISQGDVVSLAIGIVIGTAFKDVITSLVNDIIMPPIGFLTAKIDFSNLYFNLSRQKYESLAIAEAAGAPIIKYGKFLNSALSFLIIALVVFIFIHKFQQYLNSLQGEAEKSPKTKRCPHCREFIRIKATRCPNCTSKLDLK